MTVQKEMEVIRVLHAKINKRGILLNFILILHVLALVLVKHFTPVYVALIAPNVFPPLRIVNPGFHSLSLKCFSFLMFEDTV